MTVTFHIQQLFLAILEYEVILSTNHRNMTSQQLPHTKCTKTTVTFFRAVAHLSNVISLHGNKQYRDYKS